MQKNLIKTRLKLFKLSSKSEITIDNENFSIDNGSIVIAAITSCTNTSNPGVMIAAGLLAKKAVVRTEKKTMGQNIFSSRFHGSY